MKEKIQMSIFLTVFLAIYFLIHYFVINNYFSYFSFGKGAFFYILTFLLTISYPLAMVIEKKSDHILGRYFYLKSSIWMGFLFISLFVIAIFKLVNLFFTFNQFYLGITIFSISALLSIYACINALFVRVKKIKVPIKGIKKNIKIVQLSDIHLGSINKQKYLIDIVKKTNAQNPDVVVITGDLVDGSAPISEHMVDSINKIKADVFYVIGNHEIYEGLDKIMPILEKTKMKILRDKLVDWKEIKFLGIDYREGNKFVNEKIKEYKFDDKKAVILLYHAPSINADNLSERNISLHLSGHTHHGQIFPFNLLVKLAFPYVRGLHFSKDNKSFVYVSPGSGTWGPPMRLGSKSEITVIDLIKS